MAAAALIIMPLVSNAQTEVSSQYVQDPSFEKKGEGWTIDNLSAQNNSSFTKKKGTIYMEKWTSKGNAVGNASAIQTLTALPAGNYKLTVAAQNIQQDSNEAQTGASIYAGATTNSTTVTKAADYDVEFSTPGTDVTIGFRAVSASGNWICVDNFRLYYISPSFELLQTAVTNAKAVITNAERSTMAGIQPTPKANLLAAIEAAEAMTAETEAEELKNASFNLAKAQAIASENAAILKELKTASNKARTRLSSDMAESYKQALQAAYDKALEILEVTTDEDVATALEALNKAYENAEASYQSKKTLKSAITTASRAYDESKEGAETFAEAIAQAESVRDNEQATPEEMDAATTAINDATLFFRIQNGTGTAMTVKTLSVVQGATEVFARGSFTGGTAKEKGFCYSENPEPTIFDARSTTCYSNNGDIYTMQGLKPATVYYVRAYAITSSYMLSYGDVMKTVTLPMGNTTFSYDYAGDEATNTRIYDACEESVWLWNNISGIKSFHLDAHYVPGAGSGSGTADCSYGGYMRISQNTANQRTGTVLHEGAHGLGVVPYTDWVNSIYRSNGDRGSWLGPRVDRIIQFLENNPTAKLNGDNQHLWPYGINGSGEDTGSPILYRGNALVVGALAEDGIRTPNMDFVKPAYSFAQDDNTKYYIKNESTDRGLTTSYLCQTTASAVRFREMTADEAFGNDSCAWYIEFIPATCYYTFKNAATGRYLSMSTAAVTALTNSNNGKFHLLGSRNQTTVDDFTFVGTSYWVTNSSNHKAMSATATGATSVDFNHSDDAIVQRWLFLTGDEVTRFAEARGETVGINKPTRENASQLNILGGQGSMTITANGEGRGIKIYNLDGRQMQHLYIQRGATAKVQLPRGVYLVDGQKVIVR